MEYEEVLIKNIRQGNQNYEIKGGGVWTTFPALQIYASLGAKGLK